MQIHLYMYIIEWLLQKLTENALDFGRSQKCIMYEWIMIMK